MVQLPVEVHVLISELISSLILWEKSWFFRHFAIFSKKDPDDNGGAVNFGKLFEFVGSSNERHSTKAEPLPMFINEVLNDGLGSVWSSLSYALAVSSCTTNSWESRE